MAISSSSPIVIDGKGHLLGPLASIFTSKDGDILLDSVIDGKGYFPGRLASMITSEDGDILLDSHSIPLFAPTFLSLHVATAT